MDPGRNSKSSRDGIRDPKSNLIQKGREEGSKADWYADVLSIQEEFAKISKHQIRSTRDDEVHVHAWLRLGPSNALRMVKSML